MKFTDPTNLDRKSGVAKWRDLRFNLLFSQICSWNFRLRRLELFRNWCRPKPCHLSWFSPKENHSSRPL
jgi:hypothetical protein